MIRPAELPDDLPRLVEMGRRFFAVSALARVAEFDDDSFRDTVNGLSPTDTLIVAVHRTQIVGMACALTYPAWFNRRHLTGQELFWWVEPEYRGRGHGTALYGALEARMRALGLNSFSMGATETQKPDSVARFYAREGYVPTERLYEKRF